MQPFSHTAMVRTPQKLLPKAIFAITGPPHVGHTSWVGVDCEESPVVLAFMLCLLSGKPGPDDGKEDAADKNLQSPLLLQ